MRIYFVWNRRKSWVKGSEILETTKLRDAKRAAKKGFSIYRYDRTPDKSNTSARATWAKGGGVWNLENEKRIWPKASLRV